MWKILQVVAKFAAPARPFILEALEALLEGDFKRFGDAGQKAARVAGIKAAAREYLD